MTGEPPAEILLLQQLPLLVAVVVVEMVQLLGALQVEMVALVAVVVSMPMALAFLPLLV
jgi:hypothetical protein